MTILHLAAATTAVVMLPTHSDRPRQAEVHYGDLNLANVDGRAQLDRRLARAIDRVCGDGQARLLNEVYAARRCKARAHDAVAPQRDLAILRHGGAAIAQNTR